MKKTAQPKTLETTNGLVNAPSRLFLSGGGGRDHIAMSVTANRID
ncbi:hypothetical protein RBSWK_01246 [Rhodopirellula baltica SWK14]|uniref:Uncharacterized protein n=1 Tax=Rhodopirellula baltica SWK14 TaxID=993516 RepID=L7CKC2_RHOBT|nr:hypothetical protein RBSWK_01246 [Rhodopirellula baltica SWK14]